MGFTMKAYEETLTIPLRYIQPDLKNGGTETVIVSHTFQYPTLEVREQRDRDLARVKGRKVTTHRSKANWNFWCKTIAYVEGYEDDGITKETGLEQLKQYFNNPIGRVHVDDMVERFLEVMLGEEIDFEKKSEQSSED